MTAASNEYPVEQSEAHRWLAAIVESSDDAIIGKRLDGTIVSWNAGACRMFGYSASEMMGQSVLKLFPPELAHTETEIVARLSHGERVDHFETVRLRRDGTRIDVSISVSPILDEAGTIEGAAKIARDITEAKRLHNELRVLTSQLQDQATELEQQLEETATMGTELEEANHELSAALSAARRARDEADRARVEADRANRAKSEFLAMMSHELRTPLNAISGYADLMDAEVAGALPPPYRSYVDRIRKSQQHLLDLIARVLDLSKLEAGKIEVKRGPVAVATLLARLQEMVALQAAAKQQRLDVRTPPDSLRLLADEDRALQILLNLVANAIKFTPIAGRIVIDVEVAGDAVVIRVRDSGPGVSPADAVRIFQPFVQGDHSLTRSHQGAGLGLAISRDLARAMGGDVTLESTGKGGSTFAVRLHR